jgi:hypothetical protein
VNAANAANRKPTGDGRATNDGGKDDSELERLTVERRFFTEPRASVTDKRHRASEIDEEET